jgi:hypothetical protein
MYKFKRDVSSLATGKTHAAGSLVPPGIPLEQIALMIKMGDVEEVKPVVAKDEVFIATPNLVSFEPAPIPAPEKPVIKKPATRKSARK